MTSLDKVDWVSGERMALGSKTTVTERWSKTLSILLGSLKASIIIN